MVRGLVTAPFSLIVVSTERREPPPLPRIVTNTQFQNFLNSSIRVWDAQSDDVFYVYIDAIQGKNALPETLEDAYGNGFLVIEATSSGFYALTIGNQSYKSNSIWELEQVLFEWSLSEGYEW